MHVNIEVVEGNGNNNSKPKLLPPCETCAEPSKMECVGCGNAKYCCWACQTAHWPVHGSSCRLMQAMLRHRRDRRGNSGKEEKEEEGDRVPRAVTTLRPCPAPVSTQTTEYIYVA